MTSPQPGFRPTTADSPTITLLPGQQLPQPPPPRRPSLALLAALCILLGALLGGGACKAIRGATSPASGGASAPAFEGDLAELQRAVDTLGPVLLTARLACGLLPARDAELCTNTVDDLDDALYVARAILKTARSCQAPGDGSDADRVWAAQCLEAAQAEAREHLPELALLGDRARARAAAAPAVSGGGAGIPAVASAPPSPPASANGGP